MNRDIERLEPASVWTHFAGLAEVPRPSKREAKIQAHALAWAEKHALKATKDATGNIVVEVPATPGHESAPVVVLQGHLDMVCEKNEGTEHDFDADPIRLLLREENGERFVTADGTTLGADNGIGVAMAMAAATDPEVVHGPLELLLTADEEQGMTGALALTADQLQGRILINLDTEWDEMLTIGCAGGSDTNMRWNFDLETVAVEEAWRVRIRGLRGGHSGGDIHENRGNANQLLARMLARVESLRIAEIAGGNLRNAIPRESRAIVAGDHATILAAARWAEEIARNENFEDAVEVSVESVESPSHWLAETDARTILETCLVVPSGVISMHPKIPDLVQNSNNLSVLRWEPDGERVRVSVECLSRSPTQSCIDFDKQRLATIGRERGAQVSHGNEYNGWEADLGSKLLATCKRVYREVFDAEPQVLAAHGGLECGIIGNRIPGMQMISFGPNITGAHSPDEEVSVDSVARSWRYLRAVLEELA